ncbi:unnamed protein product [Brassica rapa subsp. trilocularis]
MSTNAEIRLEEVKIRARCCMISVHDVIYFTSFPMILSLEQ